MAADLAEMTRYVIPHTVMGSEAAVVCADSQVDLAVRRLAQLESMWSRFLPESEISRLNRAGGAPVRVSPETVMLLEQAVTAWVATDGAFDPTLLGTLASLGYQRSRVDDQHTTTIPADAGSIGAPASIVINPERDTVALPKRTVVDPGGVGKGLAADLVATELTEDGNGVLVEIGGDLRCAGPPPPGGWHIDVFDPERHRPVHRVAIAEGGVATSSALIRSWRTDSGHDAHHLIDPRTLAPSATGAVACTVIAGTAAWAEVFTKVAFARPLVEALEMLQRHQLAALITLDDGTEHQTSTWKDFIR